jgi:hypothetical protein
LTKHPRASVFHTVAWLKALRQTYGYEPIVYTTSAPGEDLQNGLVFCRINSWLTGHRLVSLPFSDHCEALVDKAADLQGLITFLQRRFAEESWRYVEMRPLNGPSGTNSIFRQAESFCFHQMDLSPNLDTIFRRFHKDSTQRKIRRAEREGLTQVEGHSESLLDIFYRLQMLTRRQHQLPPQPKNWFRNLIDCFGEALRILVAFKDGQPVASILTLCYKSTLVYKYGCSNPRFNNLGGTHLLFWTSIQDAKKCGLRTFDLGRSDLDNNGLIAFKDRWGANRSTLTYVRFPAESLRQRGVGWKLRIAKRVFAHAPDRFLSAAGNVLYKHIG